MKWSVGCFTLSGVLLLVLGMTVFRDFLDVWRAGFFEEVEPVEYRGASLDNLKAQHTALMLYHDSEGQLPLAAGWMDAIENRLQTRDLKPGEGAKKLVAPSYAGQLGKYGYAMNDACSGKYKDDVASPDTTPLVFESTDAARNAHGDPKNLGRPQGQAISLGGQVLQL